MKKFLALLISLSMLIMCVPGISLVASAAFDIETFIAEEALEGRDGLSEETAYEISTGEQFEAFFNATNFETYAKGKCFKQVADITIPSTYAPFQNTATGTYDGQENTINFSVGTSSSRYNVTGSYFGIFGRSYMTLKNIVTAGDWYLTTSLSSCYVGGIAARHNGGTITNCVNNININKNSSGMRAGGIVGTIVNAGWISDCVNYGDITGGTQHTAGIAGHAGPAKIRRCENYGTIAGSSPCGGIVAGMANAAVTIENCANYGNVTSGTKAAGIAGEPVSSTTEAYVVNISNCLNAGTITNTSPVGVGGSILGTAAYDNKAASTQTVNVTITDCYNTGYVHRSSDATDVAAVGSCFAILHTRGSGDSGVSGVTTVTGTINVSNFYDIANPEKPVYVDKNASASKRESVINATVNVNESYVLNPTAILKNGTAVTGDILKTVPEGWDNWEAPTAGYPYIQLQTNKIDTENAAVSAIVEDTAPASVAKGASISATADAEDVADLANVKDADGNVTAIEEGTKYAIVVAKTAAMVGDCEYGIQIGDKYFKAVRNVGGLFAVLVYDIDAGEYTFKPYVKVGETYYYGSSGTLVIAE